jgi:hypothetical protein
MAARTSRSLALTPCLAALVLALAAQPSPPADTAQAKQAAIEVTNYRDGETIRYPVPLICGSVADPAADSVTIVNASSTRDTREMAALLRGGKFKGLTELVPGRNDLVVRAGAHERKLSPVYEPQTNPYIVRAIYFVDQSGSTDFQTPIADDPQDFRGKLDTAMKLLQTFTAERLHDLGFGRRTFALEFDDAGKVKVHILRGDKSMQYYHTLDGGELYGEIAGEVARKMPHPTSHNLVVPAFTRFDPKTGKVYAHTALGGGNLALFGGGDLYAWPDSLAKAQAALSDATPVDPAKCFSDSAGRDTYWGIAATTLGAALHELGHTFGLPHSRDPEDIMSRGFDHFNRFFTLVEPPCAGRDEPYEFQDDEIAWWAPVSAGALAPSRFFALDARTYSDDNKTEIRLDPAAGSFVVESDNGIRHVGVYRYSQQAGTEAIYAVPIDPSKKPPKTLSVPIIELGKRVGSPDVGLHVIDDQGLDTTVRCSDLLAGPYVQAWQFASVALPWDDPNAFASVDAKTLDAVWASASATKLKRSRTAFVDFARLAPGDRRENVAGYAARTIRADRPRRVKVLTGSDDALRIWLNGRRITEALQLRGASPDAEATVAQLDGGANRLIVEVSQAGGDWGLFLRLEDLDGGKLELTDVGDLVRVDDAATQRALDLLRGPFVRKWRFAPTTMPWSDRTSFVTLSPDALEKLSAAAQAAKMAEGSPDDPFVDFAAHFPESQRTNVAGYAFRTLRSDRARKVRIHTGSDDALRVWLNGSIITRVLKLRSAQPDAESTEADLRSGDNALLVEVSQGGGDWGLYLRLEDADGTDLRLGDDGRLVPMH